MNLDLKICLKTITCFLTLKTFEFQLKMGKAQVFFNEKSTFLSQRPVTVKLFVTHMKLTENETKRFVSHTLKGLLVQKVDVAIRRMKSEGK